MARYLTTVLLNWSEHRHAHTTRMIPIRELEIANHDFKAAKGALETALVALTVSKHELERTSALLLTPRDGRRSTTEEAYISVQTPDDGSVMRILRESEGIVTAGEPMIEIGDTTKLEIVTDLLSTDALKVKAGQRVIVGDCGGSGNLVGVVRRVEPYARTKVSALVSNGDRWPLYVEQDGRALHRLCSSDAKLISRQRLSVVLSRASATFAIQLTRWLNRCVLLNARRLSTALSIGILMPGDDKPALRGVLPIQTWHPTFSYGNSCFCKLIDPDRLLRDNSACRYTHRSHYTRSAMWVDARITRR